MIKVRNRAFILKNFSMMYFDCKGKVKEVREYLENECRFSRARWNTEDCLELDVLYIVSFNGLHEVHGDFSKKDKPFPFPVYSIKNLLPCNDLCSKSAYKPIKLKG